MGTWGTGLFESDAAADLLAQIEESPVVLRQALRSVARIRDGDLVDADLGAAAWAACEIVALAFGYGDVPADAAGAVASVRPKDSDRVLALNVLERLTSRNHSELFHLWAESGDTAQYEVVTADLRRRLEEASAGPRPRPIAKRGDILVIASAPPENGLVAIQVVSNREVGVFAGLCSDEAAALDRVTHGTPRRVWCAVGKHLPTAKTLGNVPVRPELRQAKALWHCNDNPRDVTDIALLPIS